MDEVTTESTLLESLNVIHRNINEFSLVVLANVDRTQIQASLSTQDLLKFMMSNYEGPLDVFEREENKINVNT